ncbi:septation ring formation regulator EzrA [Bacillus horti]|nr:septation ring formation regulator EzrA [Bacillus horti]
MTLYRKKIGIHILIVLILFILPAQMAYAQFPDREHTHLVDPQEYLSSPERVSLNGELSQFEHDYVVVLIDELEEPQRFTNDLFVHYSLTDTSVLFVIAVEEGNKLYYAYGEQLDQLGLTDERIESRVSTIYQSYADQQNYATAMKSLIQGIETDLVQLAEQRSREAELTVGGQQNEQLTEEASDADSSMPWWVILLIVLFIGLIVFIVFSILYRRKVMRSVDELEAEKIKLENRPFSAQLSRVKGLKMAGETEESFEKWRAKWEEILTVSLPEIEEVLIDIEDYADHYRFIRAAQLLRETKATLNQIESELDQIVQEIDELTSSEKQSREKISYLHEQYQEVKSALQKESLALGISYPVWHEKFKKTGTWFESFEAAQQNGDYLSAQDYVQAIEDVFTQIREALEEIPACLTLIENEIPGQLNELLQAIDEMKEKGYVLEHTGVQERYEELKKKQLTVVQYMQDGQIKEMKEWIGQVQGEIEELFLLLEEEVTSKAFVLDKLEIIPSLLEEMNETSTKLGENVQITKASYSWENEWEEEFKALSDRLIQLTEKGGQIKQLQEEVEEKYPELRTQIMHFIEEYDQYKMKVQAFEETINKLREEELKARETAVQLKQTLVKLRLKLRKSNLPGVPEHISIGLGMAEEAVDELQVILQQQQIELPRVLHVLKDAKTEVESVSQATKSVITQAHKAEQYIQYGNRFRRYDTHVDELLQEAEAAFRRCQYREALDYAEASLDKADRQWRDVFDVEEEQTGS